MKAVWVAVALMVSTGALAKDPADKDELAFVLKGGMQIAPGDLDKVDPEPQTYGSVGVKDEHLEIKPKQSVTQITESLDVGAVMDPIHLQPSLGLVSNIQAGGLKLLNGWNLSSCSFGIGLTSTLAYGIHNQKDPKAQDGQDIAGFGTLSAGPMAGLICEPTGHNLLILAEASLEASGRVYGESDGTHVGGGLKGTGTLQVSTTG
ncbi:MAG TPA: hypothetical protein VL588_11170, partial [Bdellovibrionota bacterium]|nr:hypothetical protein [Bdellovibrionota bacterium]